MSSWSIAVTCSVYFCLSFRFALGWSCSLLSRYLDLQHLFPFTRNPHQLMGGGYGGEWVGLPNRSCVACSPSPPAPATWFYSRSHSLQNLHRSHVGSSNFSGSIKIPAVHEPPCWSARPLFLNETSELKESLVFFLARVHGTGPKTVFFWAPMMKWCLVLAGVKDLSRPADKLSMSQNLGAFLRYRTRGGRSECFVLVSRNSFGSDGFHLGSVLAGYYPSELQFGRSTSIWLFV